MQVTSATAGRWAGSVALVAAMTSGALMMSGPFSPLAFLLGPMVTLAFAGLALWLAGKSAFKSYAFTAWVFAFVAASMFYPRAFGTWFGYDLKGLIIPLVQLITFGMGTTLSVKDFTRVLMMPWAVFVGMLLQYTVMPLVGFAIAMTFGFPPEVAAGVILIGSVSGGVASNLINYLAGSNVALSVTMTAVSTLMAPVMTPFLMKVLAGRLVPIDFFAMVLEILNMVIVPVVAGLAANKVLYGDRPWCRENRSLGLIGVACIALAVGMSLLPSSQLGSMGSLKGGAALGFALIGLVSLAKLVVTNLLKGPANWMDRTLPMVSMAGICVIIAIITARSQQKLLTVGPMLICAAIVHNALGYLLGYWGARALRLDEISCRTVAVEVGMQNGGMASGLAMGVLRSADAALAPAIFGPWMNISGSVLASFWKRRPPKQQPPPGGTASS